MVTVYTLNISSSNNLAASFPKSSGTDGPRSEPFGFEANSAARNAPLIVSATRVKPKPGDLDKNN